MTDSQNNDRRPCGNSQDRSRFRSRRVAFEAGALLLAVACVVTGAACWLRTPASGETSAPASTEDTPPPTPRGLYAGWPAPDFVLLLSAQQHGYLGPCGCSRPQYGGLERRYNLVQQLRDKGWPVVALDLGDIPQKEGPARLPNVQGLIKYRYSMEALKKIGYTAVSFGEYEAELSLFDTLAEYALNEPIPAVLAANLRGKDRDFPDDKRRSKSSVGSWEVARPAPGITVGVVGIIGTYPEDRDSTGKKVKSIADLISARDGKFRFDRADESIAQVQRQMQESAERPTFRVLLYQGLPSKARLLARAIPDFHVILCLSEEDEPPGRPDVVGQTFVVRVGHKGKNVGVVGVKRTNDAARPFELRYQLVSLGEEYITPADKEAGHPIAALMERYTKELSDENYLARYRQNTHPVQFGASQLKNANGQPKYPKLAEYAGSESCKKCHEHAYKVWKESAHVHAYQTLVNATRPGNRPFDPECIVCHTIGFGYRGGFTDAARTAHLKDVGCESCHGPSKLHKENPNDESLYPLINPWKGQEGEAPQQREKRMLAIEQMCRGCHDQDNDVHWTFDKWTKKNIIHMTPLE